MAQDNIRNLTGEAGGKFIGSGTTYNGNWMAVTFTQNSQIDSITTNIDQSSLSFNGQNVPAGLSIFGKTTSIKLSAGTAILYNRAP
tara:strand:- start:247 stop:504 length:258 start_codon:yes stop_codon:yes gene_type:complete